MSENVDSLAGTRLGRFRITRLIGKGGMGEVYAALDEHLDREVAVKVLGAAVDIEPHRRRFLREARLAARLNHPNIASIHEVGDSDGRLYIVMELLEGTPLRNLLQERRLTIDEITTIARDIARALARAHAGDVIHRDVKPENVFITSPAPDVLFAKVLDFGLARDELLRKKRNDDENTATDLTGPGEACGTAGYLAPEQARGLALDVRADVFSFGAVLYEMLTGKRAFDGRNQLQKMLAVVKSEPPPIRSLVPDLSPELEEILKRCLAKQPADRYADGGELTAAIDALMRGSQRGTAAAIDMSSRHLEPISTQDKTEAMESRPMTPPRPRLPRPTPPPRPAPRQEEESTSSSAAILSAQPISSDPPSSSDADPSSHSSSNNSTVRAAGTSSATTTTSGTSTSSGDDANGDVDVASRRRRAPIPYPVLTRWLTKEQREHVKPLLFVAGGGLLLSLFIIVGISAATKSKSTRPTSAQVSASTGTGTDEPRASEIAAPRELANGSADQTDPKSDDAANAATATANADSPSPSISPTPPSPDAIDLPSTPTASPANHTAARSGFTRLPTPHATPSAPPSPPPPPPPAAPAQTVAAVTVPKPTTGTVHITNNEVLTIIIDGDYRRLTNGNVVVSCGRHRVRIGLRGEQIVDVPCGGTTTL